MDMEDKNEAHNTCCARRIKCHDDISLEATLKRGTKAELDEQILSEIPSHLGKLSAGLCMTEIRKKRKL